MGKLQICVNPLVLILNYVLHRGRQNPNRKHFLHIFSLEILATNTQIINAVRIPQVELEN